MPKPKSRKQAVAAFLNIQRRQGTATAKAYGRKYRSSFKKKRGRRGKKKRH